MGIIVPGSTSTIFSSSNSRNSSRNSSSRGPRWRYQPRRKSLSFWSKTPNFSMKF